MNTATKKRGRPAKAEAEKRTKHAEAWLSPAEHEHLQASSGKQSLPAYVRDLALQDWTPSASQQSGRRGRPPQAKRLQIRLTYAEKEHLANLAAQAKMPVSDYIRLAMVVQSGFDAEKHVLRLEVRPGLGRKLAERAAQRGQSVAEYVLSQAEAEPVAGAVGKEAGNDLDAAYLLKLDRLKQSLDRIGKNYNQVVAALHSDRHLPGLDAATAQEFKAESSRVGELIEKVASRYAW